MNSVLTDFLKSEASAVRQDAERRKAAKLDWQRAAQDLVTQMIEWLKQADPDGLLRVEQTSHTFEDYDLGRYVIKGLSVTLDRATARLVPSHLDVVGEILVPGESMRRRLEGRMVFDNGTDRIALYRVKDGERDIWLWWGSGGVGKPFDRESFEATVVSLLR